MPKAAPPEMPTSIDEGKVLTRFYGRIYTIVNGCNPSIGIPRDTAKEFGFVGGKQFRASVREIRVRRSRKVVIVLEAV